MNDDAIRDIVLENWDASSSDLDDSFVNPEFVFETINSLSDSDDLAGILCLDSDAENETHQLDGPDIIESTESDITPTKKMKLQCPKLRKEFQNLTFGKEM